MRFQVSGKFSVKAAPFSAEFNALGWDEAKIAGPMMAVAAATAISAGRVRPTLMDYRLAVVLDAPALKWAAFEVAKGREMYRAKSTWEMVVEVLRHSGVGDTDIFRIKKSMEVLPADRAMKGETATVTPDGKGVLIHIASLNQRGLQWGYISSTMGGCSHPPVL